MTYTCVLTTRWCPILLSHYCLKPSHSCLVVSLSTMRVKNWASTTYRHTTYVSLVVFIWVNCTAPSLGGGGPKTCAWSCCIGSSYPSYRLSYLALWSCLTTIWTRYHSPQRLVIPTLPTIGIAPTRSVNLKGIRQAHHWSKSGVVPGFASPIGHPHPNRTSSLNSTTTASRSTCNPHT